MRRGGRFVAVVSLIPTLIPALAPVARAERPAGVCIEVSVDFTPADNLQIVAWLEDAAGTYRDTLYITQKTGRYGMGNRPGRHDFNTGSASGDTFPYGRRDQTFPVWAHRHGREFPLVVFQNGDDDNLSHPFAQSSPETPPPYCRPIQPTEMEFDSGTCASATFSDKGIFSSGVSRYPPRSDIQRRPEDSASVDLYRANNPFDSVSRATPASGMATTATWAAPQSIDYGSYVLFVETSKTYDFNTTYNATTYPAPTGIPWAEYGKPWRGQPSIVYRVPFTVAMAETSGATDTYVGYGDPKGEAGTLNPPDATITTDTPGSGAARMQLVSDASTMYRVRVRTKAELDSTPPGPLTAAAISDLSSMTASVAFRASGDDGNTGRVTGYDVRIRAGSPITDANFEESTPIAMDVAPGAPGDAQTVELTGLLPETDYWVGIRAFDNCFNRGELTVVQLTTLDREVAAVDWCFVATAAYGSVMANDVTMLRHVRDSLLRTTVLGELAVASYYTFGPAAAAVIGESDLLRASARAILAPIIAAVRRLSF